MVSKGQFVGLDWNPLTGLHSQVMTGKQELTNSIALSHLSISRCSKQTSTNLHSEFSLHIKSSFFITLIIFFGGGGEGGGSFKSAGYP